MIGSTCKYVTHRSLMSWFQATREYVRSLMNRVQPTCVYVTSVTSWVRETCKNINLRMLISWVQASCEYVTVVHNKGLSNLQVIESLGHALYSYGRTRNKLLTRLLFFFIWSTFLSASASSFSFTPQSGGMFCSQRW